MDHQRVHRIGNRTYYRNSYMQSPNSRSTIEERLHAQGISTSSNSSWTFSNSHSEIPRKKKGRLCGLFLMVAVLVVLLVVIAIGILAFYLGVVRVDNPKQELIFDGSLRITYGDQYQAALNNRSNKIFREKASRYSNMITNVYQKSLIAPALEEVKVLKFENGSLIIHFRVHLDRRKLPNSGTAVEEVLKNILLEEIRSLKPVAFRNLQVDHQNLYIKRYLGDVHSLHEDRDTKVNNHVSENNASSSPKTVEVKNGVVRKVSQDSKLYSRHENRTATIPEGAIIGISEKMQNLSDTLKKKTEENGRKTSTTPKSAKQEDIKSTDFDKGIDFAISNKMKPQMTVNEESSIVREVDLVSHAPGSYANEHPNEQRLTIDDKNVPMNGHARPPFELSVGQTMFYTPPRVTPNSGFLVSDYDEPWRPIIPSHREQISAKETVSEIYDEIVMAGVAPKGDSPITFSRESYEENLRISPEYGNKKMSKITEDIAKKYEELLKNHRISNDFGEASSLENALKPTKVTKNDTAAIHSNDFTYDSKLPLGLDQIISGISVIGSDIEEPFVESTTEMVVTVDSAKPEVKLEETSTSEAPTNSNVTLKNPFAEAEDSRSAPLLGFNLPDFPILKQFHHLDSLLKSFSPDTPHDDMSRPSIFVNDSSITRFPVRTKATTEKPVNKIFVAVSTIGPESTTKQTVETYRTPIVIKGEVQVLDSKNIGTSVITTEQPKLITLLPVRSNVKGPLRPRPKAIDSAGRSDNREPKVSSTFKSGGETFPRVLYSIPQKHHFIDDKDGKRWVYYSSSKLLTTTPAPSKPEKLFIVTPQNDNTIKPTSSKPIRDEVIDQTFRDSAEGREDTEIESNANSASTNTSELINKIVNIMENIVISTGNSTKVILKVNQTIINGTNTEGNLKMNDSALNDPKYIISTKAVSSQYKLNQAGIPILTKILNKAPNYYKNERNETVESEPEADNSTTPLISIECYNNTISCGNGTCLPLSARCNQQIDCPDAVDEKNCSCAEHLRTQHFNRKLCDGIVDCWDFSDEFGCDWCKGKDYLCSSSKMCIKKSQICDGANNCPLGDDEKYCVTVSPNKKEANSFNYHPNGYLMVRKHGEWGKLCIDNFDAVSMKSKTGWKISDLGRSVCKALTFKDFDKVERMISVPNEGRSFDRTEGERYYELSYNDVADLEESSTRDSTLSFHETECVKKEVVKVTCTDLECGLRPQAMNQWSRIVGGGNANPGSWPWQAALYKEGEFQCGATLISGQWLVSAGHCFYHNQDEYWVARLGTLRTTSSLPSPYEQLRQISKIILHPHYVDTGFINDISLLKMADPVTFTDYVRPICLPKSNAKIIDGMMCTVVGWGQLFEIGRIFPDTLQEVQLPIISSTECRKRTVFLPLYKITDDMFCAGFDRGGRDACLGDSGGPLMCQESDGKWSLYGVTSNGYGCARSNRPGVYTKVSKYLHWLQAQMHLYSEDDTLNQNSLKRLSSLNSDRPGTNGSILNGNYTMNDKKTDTLIKIISERVSNVKFSTGIIKKKDKCKGHRCPLGECLSKNRLCNGLIECSDGSDEKDCW